MKKYIVVTNVWGKKQRGIWDNLVDVFKEEREFFDTKEEADAYIALFEEIYKTYDVPAVKLKSGHNNVFPNKVLYDFKTPKERAWGWVLGDTESCTVIKWGGIGMYNISKKDNALRIKDYLFRGKDEIPKNYKWDDGEYEGWLQFRWGDGKNAIDYVEPKKIKHLEDIAEDHSAAYERINREMDERQRWRDAHPDEWAEEIEEAARKYEEKERLKIIGERW
jgi:hypothetical protein